MSNILITGAAGYIGGTLLTELLSLKDGLLKDSKLFVVVRSQDQVDMLSKLEGPSVHQLDILDESAVEAFVKQREVDLIVHLAGSVDQRLAANMLNALGKRRAEGAKNLSFIHSSVGQAFTVENGWPYGAIRDDDAVIEKERQIGDEHPVRKTNVFVADQGKALGVTTYNVTVPFTYGKGTGLIKQVSVSIPAYIRNSLKNRVVYRFEQDGQPFAAHVTDLAQLYVLLMEKILQREDIPSDQDGTYFGLAHKVSWWKIKKLIAQNLYERGLVDDPKPRVWPSYEQAADELGFPRAYIRGMGSSSGDQVPVKAAKYLGWKPQWTEETMMDRIDEDIQACLELDTGKLSLYDTLVDKSSA